MELQDQANWPPEGTPLYVPVETAAGIAGVSQHLMYSFVKNAVDPIPHIKSGNKPLIRVSALPEYLKGKEAV